MRDTARGHAGYHVRATELVVDHMHELLADVGAHSRVGERLAVVAVDRALPPAGPGEGFLRAKFDGLDLEEELGYFERRIERGCHAAKVYRLDRGEGAHDR